MRDTLPVVSLQFIIICGRHADHRDEGANWLFGLVAPSRCIEDQDVDEAVVEPFPTCYILEQQDQSLPPVGESFTDLAEQGLEEPCMPPVVV